MKKIKRFKNLWTMGLILCGALLVTFYVIKIFFPQFIIGIAETPRIVKIGTAIQSNKWYLHLFNFGVGAIHGYILCCACCRTYNFKWKGFLVFFGTLILLRLVAEFYQEHYATVNYVNMVVTPFLICAVNKRISKETFISTAICFTVDLLFQVFSVLVRNLPSMADPQKLNIASSLILLIDLVIWRILLCLFFNYKTKNKEIEENGN